MLFSYGFFLVISLSCIACTISIQVWPTCYDEKQITRILRTKEQSCLCKTKVVTTTQVAITKKRKKTAKVDEYKTPGSNARGFNFIR